jgi:hypothetical protein
MNCRLNGQGSSSSRDKIFQFSIGSRQARVLTKPPIQSVMGTISLKVKWLGCKADHPHPSSVKGKNGFAIPPLSHVSPRDGS